MEEQDRKSPISVFHHIDDDDDDGGSFDRLVQETLRLVGGTADDPTNLLQFRVLKGFVSRLSKDGASFKKSTCLSSCDVEQQPEKKKATVLKFVLKRKSEGSDDQNKIFLEAGSMKNKSKKMRLVQDPLSSELEKRIAEKGGTDVTLVIRKPLFKSDLATQNARFSIPPTQIRDEHLTFLTDQEKSVLANINQTVPVMLMEPCGYESSLLLVKWKYDSTYSFMLKAGWNDVLRRNHVMKKHFKLADVVQVWSFRVNGHLWFAIDKVRDAPSSEF